MVDLWNGVDLMVAQQHALLTLPTAAPVQDPFWGKVVLLMSFDGANLDASGPGFTDYSPFSKGNATVGSGRISTVQSVFGGSSLLCVASGTNGFSFPDHPDWTLGNQPFTIEFRFRPSSLGFYFFLSSWYSAPNLGWVIYQDSSFLKVNWSTTGSDNLNPLVSNTALFANVWYTLCWEFDGTKHRLYQNGIMVASTTTAYNIWDSNQLLAFGGVGGSYTFPGNADELRFTKAARYASDSGYTPSPLAFPRVGGVPAAQGP